jgi:SSS family solute:Na+ symporter
VLGLPKTFSINLQLLGGIWILQTFPAIVAGLYTRWFHRWALVIGWAAAMVYGTIQAYRAPVAGQPNSHLGGSTAPVFGHVMYIAIAAFVLNVVIAVIGTLVFRALRFPAGSDETLPHQYSADPATAPAVVVPEAAAAAAGTGAGHETPPID